MKRAFTIVELLVVILLVAVVAALLIPALLAARENTRALHCSNNLRQIGIGVANYVATSGVFPPAIGIYSPITRILPDLDQGVLYDKINFSASSLQHIQEFASIAVPVLACPDDPARTGGMTSYCLNGGMHNETNAPFSYSKNYKGIGLNQVTDGLSATALASEWQAGSLAPSADTQRIVFRTSTARIHRQDFERFCNECRLLGRDSERTRNIKGESWIRSGFGYTSYNHAMPPGSNSCMNGTLLQYGAWSASSLHRKLVHVVMCDGHLESTSYGIDRATWLSKGTMNGGEIISIQ